MVVPMVVWSEVQRQSPFGRGRPGQYGQLAVICLHIQALAPNHDCPCYAFKRLCYFCLTWSVSTRVFLRHKDGTVQSSPNRRTRPAKFLDVRDGSRPLPTGSYGAASTDTFINITLQRREIILMVASTARLSASVFIRITVL